MLRGSPHALSLLAAAAVLIALFIGIEARGANPLVPLRLFRSTTLNAANAIGVLRSALFAWLFLGVRCASRAAFKDCAACRSRLDVHLATGCSRSPSQRAVRAAPPKL